MGRHQEMPRVLCKCHTSTAQYPSAPEREWTISERKKTTRALLSTQYNPLWQGMHQIQVKSFSWLQDTWHNGCAWNAQEQSKKLTLERLCHQVICQAMEQWHVLYELSGNRTTLCGPNAAGSIRSAGWQTAKCTEQWFYLQGHVPWGHIYSFFQLLGLSRGSFTLQATLMQNIVEHLDQEKRTVLKQTEESTGTCLILLTTTSMICCATRDYLHTAAQSCMMKAATDSCR